MSEEHNITIWQQQNPVLSQKGLDESTWNTLKQSIFPSAQDDSILMAVDYCRARKLDILMKPVHLVPMPVKDPVTGNFQLRDVVMPGIGLYRIQAERTGTCAGSDSPEFGPMIEGVFHDRNGQEVRLTYPEWCKYTVYKLMPTGERVAYSALEYWEENYATQKRGVNAPNDMWMKRPRGQLAKCFDADTEVLTVNGFKQFKDVSEAILQVTDNGLEATDAKPFSQEYDGAMITANGARLNFCVTPNHNMITTSGDMDASDLYHSATTDMQKLFIPLTVDHHGTAQSIPDDVLALVGYFLADGSHTGYKQMRIAVSRPYKIDVLDALELHTAKGIKHDKASYSYPFALISKWVNPDKSIITTECLNLTANQAAVVVGAMLLFDGSDNGSGAKRLSQKNHNVVNAFDVLCSIAGISTSINNIAGADCQTITATKSNRLPVYKGHPGSRSSLVIEQNQSGKVYCVTVPSGKIIVRRHGFAMVCGNCSEAQALRRAWPETDQGPAAEEMEGKTHSTDDSPAPAPIKQVDAEVIPDSTRLADYPAADFGANFPKWKAIIDSGKGSADQIIRMISSRFTLSEEQSNKIKGL